MGGCFSDVRGGQEAVGGTKIGGAPTSCAGTNDAIDHFYASHGCQGLFTQLELSLSANKLLDMDMFSKSDPMAIVYAKSSDGKLEEIGRTEVIINSLDPVWITKVSTVYKFEMVQQLVFRVYDIDSKYQKMPLKTLNLDEQDFLGEATCALSEIVTKNNKSLTLKLTGRNRQGATRNQGTITVYAEETISSRQCVEMIFRCSKLDNKDVFSKSDPFLRISRIAEGVSIAISKTEVVENNLNPTWKPMCLTSQQFGSKDTPLVIECFDFDSDGKHELIGKIQKSVEDLEKLYVGKVGENFYIPSKKGTTKKLKGQLFVDKFIEKTQYSFLNYISSGFELNFMVAVDFTASNGHPHSPTSLHYIDPSGRLNAYQQAIFEVGEVIQFYDSDKRFPAWGFGGRPPHDVVSHCFNLNGRSSSDESEVEGVSGIMSAYSSALQHYTLHGPTLFGKVINRAAQIAADESMHNQTKYYVLLIITDGVVTDLQETIDSLVRASDLPLSILIIGVGSADFTNMEVLDADNGHRLQSSTGQLATRDIVQFVPMREVQGNQLSVVQSLLEELPGQFLTYMRSRDIKPLHISQSKASAGIASVGLQVPIFSSSVSHM